MLVNRHRRGRARQIPGIDTDRRRNDEPLAAIRLVLASTISAVLTASPRQSCDVGSVSVLAIDPQTPTTVLQRRIHVAGKPQNITVRSNRCGSATNARAVQDKLPSRIRLTAM